MKYALTNGQRGEAQPDLPGECPRCGSPMVAKCGEIKIWHWAHLGKRICDPWWENETEWHRTWKSHFPSEWQERVHVAADGERHIADVKTDKDWVLEFQHSHLKPEERRSRNNFYQKLVWVIDGNRRPRYKAQFFKALDEVHPVCSNPTIRKVYLAWSQLLQEWVGSPAPVFFDFGDELPLWCLIPTNADMWVHVVAFSRNQFIELHRNGIGNDFPEYMKSLSDIIVNDSYRKVQVSSPIPQRLPNQFQKYLFRQARARSRQRF